MRGLLENPAGGGQLPIWRTSPKGALRCPSGEAGTYPHTMTDIEPSVKDGTSEPSSLWGRFHEREGAYGPGLGGHRPVRLTGILPVDWELDAYGAGFARLEERFRPLLEDMFPQPRPDGKNWPNGKLCFVPSGPSLLKECREMVLSGSPSERRILLRRMCRTCWSEPACGDCWWRKRTVCR